MKILLRKVDIRVHEMVALMLCAAALLVLFLYGSARAPIASSETQFVEKSVRGLSIVPASCPSVAHYSGECSTPEQPPVGCVIIASPSSVTSGESSTISWSSVFDPTGKGTYSISPTIGDVAGSGNYPVAPTVTTTYTLTGTRPYGGDGGGGSITFSCAVTVNVVSYSGGVCATNCGVIPNGGSQVFYSAMSGGSCQSMSRTCVDGTLSGSSVYQYCSCSTDVCSNISGDQTSPPANAHTVGGQCVCNSGYELQNGICVFTTGGGGEQCVPQYFCTGDDLHYLTNACQDQFIQACAYSCSGGACRIPAPVAHIKAVPTILHSGETSVISWSSEFVTSCAVSENNPNFVDAWSGTSGSATSSPIGQETKYTLLCTGIDGSSVSDMVRVKLVPIPKEI